MQGRTLKINYLVKFDGNFGSSSSKKERKKRGKVNILIDNLVNMVMLLIVKLEIGSYCVFFMHHT